MNRISAFQMSRFRSWLFVAIAVLVLGQASVSGHIHADTLDSSDCYACQHGQDTGKNLPEVALHQFVQPQRLIYAAIQPKAHAHRPLSAMSIRAPPATLHS